MPSVGNPVENSSLSHLLLCSSSFPQKLCSLHLPSLFSVFIHRSGHVSLFLYRLYIFSHLILHAHGHVRTLTLTHASEMRTSHGTGRGGSRWKEANLWLDDWKTERVKGQSSKAVSLSTSLTQTRTNGEMQERQPGPILTELEALELASYCKCWVY